MDGIRHSRQFAEIERLVSDYFHCHLAPVMSKTQAFLTKKQGEEMREYSTSLGGILSAMASAAQPMGDPYQVLKVTGEWNSKTTEDYIGMCKAEITGSKEIQQDLAYMAGWFYPADLPLETVRQLADGVPVTKELVIALNPKRNEWEEIKAGLDKIGYPNEL